MTIDDRDSTVTTQSEGSRSSRPGKKKQLPLWQETILLLAVALGLAIVIKALFLQAFYIPSESMEPGLVKNDRILVQKVSYWGDDTPQRGDVIVFKDPGGWLNAHEAAGPASPIAQAMAKVGLYPTGGHLVKRVIGVAGDTIECCDDQGRILVNGRPIEGSGFLAPRSRQADCDGPMVNNCTEDWTAGPVPEGRVFVMGDNRARSADSSVHMCKSGKETECVSGPEFVPTDLVVGKVFVLLWPAARFDWVGRPGTFEGVPQAS
ncbi:signal peptidase I [Nocardioides gansuensis]|uniref:Signal peptidase I n=1 Tax=Nocardioides gansuensis TaxID=2138300 RepID=A0A2T8FAE9_9ACTN|nr:signal peptidase I [Nocardioides gansuensis]PVG82657.1 signal peptidase I [Nocardioides gansuensis]